MYGRHIGYSGVIALTFFSPRKSLKRYYNLIFLEVLSKIYNLWL